MAFLALCTANAFYSYTIHFMIFYIVMEFFVYAVKLIAFTGFIIVKINFRFPVAVNTPAHAEVAKLFHFCHFLNFAMAG